MTHIDIQNMMNIYLLELDDKEKLSFRATEQEIAQVELEAFMRWFYEEQGKYARRAMYSELTKEFGSFH